MADVGTARTNAGVVTIKTKSILNKKDKSDGIRICVMRFVRPFYEYDEWLKDLSPSIFLLTKYRDARINWNTFEAGYMLEMLSNNNNINIIKTLKKNSNNGQVITLLCWERDDAYCHRRLLKDLISVI